MRTISHDTHTGPGQLFLRLTAGSVSVVADPGIDRAVVTLAPARAGDPDALDAISRTKASQAEDLLAITVPPAGHAGGFGQRVTFGPGGSVSVVQQFGVVTGEVTGLVINNDGSAVVGSIGGSHGGVRAEVRVPKLQFVDVEAGSAPVTATGRLAHLRVETGSGDVSVEDADTVDLHTGSGAIALGRVRVVKAATECGGIRADRLHSGQMRTRNGDIAAASVTGPLSLTTDFGHVNAHLAAQAPLTAVTGNGDIRVTAASGIQISDSRLRSDFGRVFTS
ncbi:DUF4097 family beta strand repeat-containing protein [Amycolatopsis sp. NPDC004079]|uniref:DUF4097 family beta strand repeat-containing protein n=1 Tax=Amycolatopsis sp. NPDC004079 TaxID=3154549 RepID=UPI0033AC119B